MDLSPQCHPARQPPHRVICFHQEHCPSASPSPSSEQEGGCTGLSGQPPFFPEQMTLGQAGTAWLEFKQLAPGSPGSQSIFHSPPRE